MKKLHYLVLALAAVAMIGLSSCKTKVKEEAKEVNTEAVQEESTATDSAAMAAPMDSTAAQPEEAPAE